MRWATLLLALVCALLPASARAEPFLPGTALDHALVADVATAALGFMSPRTLEAVPLAQLTLWGLRGLATLDPRLRADATEGAVRVFVEAVPVPRLLLSRSLPANQDPAAWGALAADMVRAAWDSSQPLRRAGTGGVLEAFLDEICNHLDPYSRYATPAEADADRRERDGQAGIGLQLTPMRGAALVRAVLDGSPAARAGLRAGDRIAAIDGRAVADLAWPEVEGLLAGPEDSTVVLTLRRGGTARTVEVGRALLLPDTVRATSAGPLLLLLRVSGFATDTGARLAEAITHALEARRPPRGIVIDLRGNPGGLLRQAVAAAEVLLSRGVVAVTVGRDPAASREYRAQGDGLAAELPVVILVDGGTASAAEILAAALADQGRGVVVGSATLGKGLVQAVAPLPNGGELLLTWSRVLAPLGWPIQGSGVLPQLCTSFGADSTARDLAALAAGELPMRDALARQRATRPPLEPGVALGLRAACPAAEGRDDDVATARYLVEHPTAYRAALLGPALP